MTKPTLPDPAAAARRVKEMARDLDPAAAARRVREMARDLDPAAAAQKVKGMAKDLASDVTESYRKSNRYLRMRVGVVGGWILLSLASLYTACPSSGPSNELQADVMLLPETHFVGQQLSVSNGSPEMWTDVSLTLDDKWTHQVKTIRAGQNVVVAVTKFQRDGTAAPTDLKPKKIEIDCREGSAALSLQPR